MRQESRPGSTVRSLPASPLLSIRRAEPFHQVPRGSHATLALATDYDCWHDTEEAVTVDAVLAVVRKNVTLAKRVIAELARDLPDPAKSPARGALAGAIMTAKEAVTPEAKKRLGWLLHEEWK